MAEAHERVVATPLLALAQTGPLDAPEWPLRGGGASRNTNTSILHFVGKGVQHAHHNHAIGATIQAGMHHRRDLMAAIEHAGVRKHQHATGSYSRGQIPLARLLESFQSAALAHRGVLGAVECLDISL